MEMRRNKKFIIKTYGCQMNELDSQRMSYMLNNMDYEETEDISQADLIIYNTCIVRKNAEQKVYGHLGAMKSLKEKNKDLIIAVCGCMVEVDEYREFIKDKFSHVDIVFGTKNIDSLPYLIRQYELSKKRIFEVDHSDDIDDIQLAIRKDKYSAFVNIIYGCNNFCSYCIVPYTRGRESSRSMDSILAEIKKLAEDGYKEITLLGQNVNSYGKDLHPCTSFTDLLEKVSEIDGIERIRFMTSHPKDLSDDLIDLIAKNDKICNHIHLPLQSGSSKILKKMNRTYDKEAYLALVKKIKDRIPGVAITTDIIIGFPGESEEDIEDTMDVIRKVSYDQCFLFKYSPRVGTKAAEMEDQVDEDIKSDRFDRVLRLINETSYENNCRYKGTSQKVLVQGPSKTDKERLTGRTDTNKIVNFSGSDDLIGQIIDVKIVDNNSFALEGEFVREN